MGNRRRHVKRVLAVASGGGHWIQLLRLQPAFEGCRIVYVCTNSGYRYTVGSSPFYVVTDAHRGTRWRLLFCALRLGLIILFELPDVVISTGAAPGYFAIRIAKVLGAKTVWVDSIANASEMSLSGRLVRPFADLWLTQWKHIARSPGPHFVGAVL